MDDKFHDQCAVFGVFDNHSLDVARISYFALYGLQHRGQESSGIAVSNGKRLILRKGMGLVRDVFKTEKHLQRLGKGIIAVGHNRYSTTGSSHINNAQPFLFQQDGKQLAIAHNGNLINSVELKKEITTIPLRSTTDTELIGALLLQSKKISWEERFYEVLPKLKGAYSLVAATPTLLFGIRDPFGVRPLLLGKINNGWVLSSEDCVFPGIGAKFVREIKPGEAIVVDKNGIKTFYQSRKKTSALCIFEYIYIARPDSTFHAQLIARVRGKCGELLAKQAPVIADMVMPVPDSGMTAAIAYAKISGIPLGEGVIKNRYIGRTFIQPDKRLREFGIKVKFGPITENLKGKRVIVVDDSIVRGTTMKQFVALLRAYGAKEVHLRIACPPITDPCFYGVDTPNKEDLIASHFQTDKVAGKVVENVVVQTIAKTLNADSLAYLSLYGLLEASGVKNVFQKNFDPEKTPFCLSCFTGKYKISINGGENKFQLENPKYPSELIENT